jgi:DNA modification methylase
MIAESLLPELQHFRALESTVIPLWYSTNYAELVVSSRDDAAPVHRWFRFKEAFSPRLLSQLLQSLDLGLRREFTLLDPFCGVGTGLLAAEELQTDGYHVRAIGIEVNPFIFFTAKTKLGWREAPESRFVPTGRRCLLRAEGMNPPLPALSSIRDGTCISAYMGKRVVALRNAICGLRSNELGDALMLGLASSIESLSRIRKDGRALRIVPKPRRNFAATIMERWQLMAEDTCQRRKQLPRPGDTQVIRGDGRRPLDLGIEKNSVDLILTSPPYPNNIDYSEVYKLELWLLGLVDNEHDFLALRKRTLRSHPTANTPSRTSRFFPNANNGPLGVLFQPLVDRCAEKQEPWRQRIFEGYFSDLWDALEQHYVCLRPGGHEILVVGNSLHGGSAGAYLVATDLIAAAMAKLIGFEVRRAIVARNLRRRLPGNHFLRESLVVLRKPLGE